MSRLLNPRMWYLVGLGALALTLDAGMKRLRERRAVGTENGRREPVIIESATMETAAPPTPPVAAQRATRPAGASSAPGEATATADDLTAIKGIGPAYARRLSAAGIGSFSELAATPPERLREITKAGAAAKPEEWIAQARALVRR